MPLATHYSLASNTSSASDALQLQTGAAGQRLVLTLTPPEELLRSENISRFSRLFFALHTRRTIGRRTAHRISTIASMKVAASACLAATLGAYAGATATDGGADHWPFHCSAGLNISSLSYKLQNQTYLITGSDGRLGGPVTEAALRNGATVVATSVTEEEAEANCAQLRETFGPSVAADCYAMDLSSFSSVRSTVADILEKHPVIDTLLHVAATIGLDNITSDGFVETVQVNTLSPVLMNNLLNESLHKAESPRVVHVGSANCYDPLGWPETDKVNTAMEWITGKAAHPTENPYYWYSFSKFVLLQYAAEMATREPAITSFSVNPGFFRDDPSKYSCLPQLLFTPCPQYPMQGASSTFFTAAQPGIENWSGSLIDFYTVVNDTDPYWVQSGETCIPRALPPAWGDEERSEWWDALKQTIPQQ